MRQERQETSYESEPSDDLNDGRPIQVRQDDLIHSLRHTLERLLSRGRSTTTARTDMLYVMWGERRG